MINRHEFCMLGLLLLVFASSKIPELPIRFDQSDPNGQSLIGILSNSLAYPVRINIQNRCSENDIRALNDFIADKKHKEKIKNLKKMSLVCSERSVFDCLREFTNLIEKLECLSLAFPFESDDIAVKKFDNFTQLKKVCIGYTNMDALKKKKDSLLLLENHLTQKDGKPHLERYGLFTYPDGVKIAPDLFDLEINLTKDKKTLFVKTSEIHVASLSKALTLERHKYVTHLVLIEPCSYEIMQKIMRIKEQGYLSTILNLSIICKDSYVYNMLLKSKTLSGKISCLSLDYVNKTPFSDPKHPTELLNLSCLRILKLQMEQSPRSLPQCKAMYQLCNQLVANRGYIQISSPNHFDTRDVFFWTQKLTEDEPLALSMPDYKIVSNILDIDIKNKHTWDPILLGILHEYPGIENINFTGKCDQETIGFLDFFAQRHHFNHIQNFTLECNDHDTFQQLTQSCEQLREKIIELKFSTPITEEQVLYYKENNIFEKFSQLLRIYVQKSNNETIDLLKAYFLDILGKRNKSYQNFGIFVLNENGDLINQYC